MNSTCDPLPAPALRAEADDAVFERAYVEGLLRDRESLWHALFAQSRDGVVVVVRPDQYVAHVLPLTATDAPTAPVCLARWVRMSRARPTAGDALEAISSRRPVSA